MCVDLVVFLPQCKHVPAPQLFFFGGGGGGGGGTCCTYAWPNVAARGLECFAAVFVFILLLSLHT